MKDAQKYRGYFLGEGGGGRGAILWPLKKCRSLNAPINQPFSVSNFLCGIVKILVLNSQGGNLGCLVTLLKLPFCLTRRELVRERAVKVSCS